MSDLTANTGMHVSKTRVLYLYTGLNRAALLQPIANGTVPASALRGFLELKDREELDVTLFDLSETLTSFPPLIRKYIPNDILYMFAFSKLTSHDCIIASEVYLLGFVVSLYAKVFGKPQWIYVPINSSVLARRHNRHLVKRFALSIFWKSFSRIAYITESQRADFITFGVRKEALVSVPFGVDVKYFQHTYEGGEYILSVGRDLGRNYSALFRVAKLLPYKFIVATSPSNVPEGTPIPENVTVRYNIPPDDVRKLYRDARVVVLFLDDDDSVKGSDCTGQTVMLEAMSACRPIFASNRKWIQEYFVEGVEYCPIPKADDNSIAEALSQLWENPKAREMFAKNGHRKVTSTYSSSAYAVRLANVINSTVVRTTSTKVLK